MDCLHPAERIGDTPDILKNIWGIDIVSFKNNNTDPVPAVFLANLFKQHSIRIIVREGIDNIRVYSHIFDTIT